MTIENPIDLARTYAEQNIPLESRSAQWNERWDAARAYIGELLKNETAPFTIANEQRAAIATMDYKVHVDEIPQRLQFQQDLALAALKGLTLVNGGAVVGLLTFIGNRNVHVIQALLGNGMIAFVTGLVLNLSAYILGYISQAIFMNVTTHQAWNDQRVMMGLEMDDEPARYLKIGNRVLYPAILTAIGSLVAFGTGAYFVARAFFS